MARCNENKHVKKGENMRFGGIFAVIIILVALIGGYMFYQNNYKNKPVPINTSNQSQESVPY